MSYIITSRILQRFVLVCLLFLNCALPTWAATATEAALSPIQSVKDSTHIGERIINGQPTGGDTMETPPWIALVGSWGITADMITRGLTNSCTGQFITVKWVLTARHCVMDKDDVPIPASDLRVAGGDNKVSALEKRWKPVSRVHTMDKLVDVALLELSEDYNFDPTLKFSGVPLYHGDGYMTQPNVAIMGFGITEKGSKPDELNFALMIQKGWTARDFYGAPALLLTPFVAATSGNSAPGDSGGPALLEVSKSSDDSGNRKLVGVSSQGNSSSSTYTHLSADVLTWLSETLGVAIISSPSDERVFDTRKTTNITVEWYGNTPPSRVYLKKSWR